MEPSDDKYLAYVPLLGAALALTFDVGVFYAIGIDFFTLFSLSEHIVFALQALPVALLILLVIIMILPIIPQKFPKQPDTPSSTPQIVLTFKIKLLLFTIFAILVLALLVAVFFLLAAIIKSPTPELIIIALIIIIVAVVSFIPSKLMRFFPPRKTAFLAAHRTISRHYLLKKSSQFFSERFSKSCWPASYPFLSK
jgi:hypothetical protein